MSKPGPWRGYKPDHFRSDAEQALEIDDVEASILAELSVAGTIEGEGGFGFYYAFGWHGCCSPDYPTGIVSHCFRPGDR